MFATISVRFFASKVAAARVASVAFTPEVLIIGMKISPYAMYVKKNFKNDSNIKNTDLMKELSMKWKELSNSEKMYKYTELLNKYNEKKLNDFVKLSTEEQSSLLHREKRKQDGRPTVPPSAYALFIKVKLSGAGHDAKEKMKEAVAEWKMFTDEHKKKYTDEAKKLKDEYHSNIEKWEAENNAKASELIRSPKLYC